MVKKTSAKPKFEAFKVNQKVSVTVKGKARVDKDGKDEGNINKYNGFIMSETEARNTMNIYSWNPLDPNCQRVLDANRLVSDIQVEYQNETFVWPGYAKIEDHGNSRLWYLGQNVSGIKLFRGKEVDFDQPLIKVDFEPLPQDTYYVRYNLNSKTPTERDTSWWRYGVFHASDIDKPDPEEKKPVRRSSRIRNRAYVQQFAPV